VAPSLRGRASGRPGGYEVLGGSGVPDLGCPAPCSAGLRDGPAERPSAVDLGDAGLIGARVRRERLDVIDTDPVGGQGPHRERPAGGEGDLGVFSDKLFVVGDTNIPRLTNNVAVDLEFDLHA